MSATAPSHGGAPALHVLAAGGPGIGSGHLGRCLALTQAWVAAGGVACLDGRPARPLDWVERYRRAGAAGCTEGAADVVVADGYDYRDDDVAERASGARVVRVDDHATGGPARADLVIDQNLGALAEPYHQACDAPVEVLAGPRYALLRAEVVAARPSPAPDRAEPVRRLLVSMGGSPDQATEALFSSVADRLRRSRGVEVVELAGLADVSPVLVRGDLAVSAAGSTVWELACYGIPGVVVAVADNQQPIARRLGRSGAAIDAGDIGDIRASDVVDRLEALVDDPEARTAMSRRARRLVDGSGARRAATAVRSLLVELEGPSVTAERLRWQASTRTGETLGFVEIELAGPAEAGIGLEPEWSTGGSWASAVLVAASRQAARHLAPKGVERLVARPSDDGQPWATTLIDADFDPLESPSGTEPQTYTRLCHD